MEQQATAKEGGFRPSYSIAVVAELQGIGIDIRLVEPVEGVCASVAEYPDATSWAG
jgi:hypothetical protein